MSYTAKFHLYKVNKDHWGDGDLVDGFLSATITKDLDTLLLEDATCEVEGNPFTGYVRMVMTTNTGQRVPLGTFLILVPSRTIKGIHSTTTLECTSVLQPASDKLMPLGWCLPKGGDPVARACELLGECLQCPLEFVESSVKTKNTIVAEENESYLSMVVYLLGIAGYRLCIDGEGQVTVVKENENPVALLDDRENDILLPELTDTSDFYEIPTVLRVTSGEEAETVRNELETEWERWQTESITLEQGESLLEKANERLEELSTATRTVSYQREYDHRIRVGDYIQIHLPKQEIMGVFQITGQSLEIGNGILVSETAEYKQDYRRA